ncbi:MAG: type II toxin-antitoxin system VapC family toxin [Acidobacteria bacterium]|nr:type II toxin-antitoxin system VapC family toxin [Acidobacteriota bacterium]
MKFWDTSALIPLLTEQADSPRAREILSVDPGLVVWWGSQVEIASAFSRLNREGVFDETVRSRLESSADRLLSAALEILPTTTLRRTACTLFRRHPLRAADALQLAAALVWSDHRPFDRELVCLDTRLAAAARGEGFTVLPGGL